MNVKVSFILCINCGSSSLKFSLYQAGSLKSELQGAVSEIGTSHSRLEIKNNQQRVIEQATKSFKTIDLAVKAVIRWLKKSEYYASLSAIGHRLVQGGPDHREPELITADLLSDLQRYVYLAPNHLPDELKTVKLFQSSFPKIQQVACYDTAFHKDMPDEAKYYPLPAKYRAQGLLHYGFHGLSYEFILKKLLAENPALIGQKIIIAHLGNGSSMTAIKHGTSVETTMGMSPIGGLVMSSRSGDLDPGVLLFLLKHGKLTSTQLDNLLSKNSGLKAIAGSGDVQELLNLESHDAAARAALTLFCYQARKYIGALTAAMGGLDMLVFTGGIGQHSSIIRERICRDLLFLGVDIDQSSNHAHAELISAKSSPVVVKVLATNEEAIIAHHTQKLTHQ